jgi:hypothetical protein
MKRRDLISGILGLPAMAGMKATPLSPGEPPFVIVLQPDRPLPSDCTERMRIQMDEFVKTSGINARVLVLPYGVTMTTIPPGGATPDEKPWVGPVVLSWWEKAGPGESRSFQVVNPGDGYHLLLLTHVFGSKYGHVATDDKVKIASNGEVDPYDAIRVVASHKRAAGNEQQKEAMRVLQDM